MDNEPPRLPTGDTGRRSFDDEPGVGHDENGRPRLGERRETGRPGERMSRNDLRPDPAPRFPQPGPPERNWSRPGGDEHAPPLRAVRERDGGQGDGGQGDGAGDAGSGARDAGWRARLRLNRLDDDAPAVPDARERDVRRGASSEPLPRWRNRDTEAPAVRRPDLAGERRTPVAADRRPPDWPRESRPRVAGRSEWPAGDGADRDAPDRWRRREPAPRQERASRESWKDEWESARQGRDRLRREPDDGAPAGRPARDRDEERRPAFADRGDREPVRQPREPREEDRRGVRDTLRGGVYTADEPRDVGRRAGPGADPQDDRPQPPAARRAERWRRRRDGAGPAAAAALGRDDHEPEMREHELSPAEPAEAEAAYRDYDRYREDTVPYYDETYDEYGNEYDLEQDFSAEGERPAALGDFDDPYQEYERSYDELDDRRRRGPLVLLGALVGVAVIVGGLFAYYSQGSLDGDSGSVPVIQSDREPTKVPPEEPGGVAIPQKTKLIYDRIIGEGTLEEDDRLVPREEPVRELAPDIDDGGPGDSLLPAEPGSARSGMPAPGDSMSPAEGGATATEPEPLPVPPPPSGTSQLIQPGTQGTAANTFSDNANIPPAGFQSFDGGGAGDVTAAVPPVPAGSTPAETRAAADAGQDTQVAAATPADDTRPRIDQQSQTAPAASATRPAPPVPRAKPAVPVRQAAAPAARRAEPGVAVPSGPMRIAPLPGSVGSEPARPTTSPDAAGVAPQDTVPQQTAPRATNFNAIEQQPGSPQPVTNIGSPSPSAPTETAALTPPAPQPEQVAAPPAGTYLAQLGSYRTQEEAANAFEELKGRHGSILGNYQAFFQPANLGERGTFYRLRVGPISSRDQASRVCDALISAGAPDCLVRQQ